jgi:hypothetical protein
MHLFSALPSVEDRMRELDILRAQFEGFGEKIPIIINLETTDDADAERVTEWSRLAFLFMMGCWWGNLRERGRWGDPDVDGRIIRWIFRKWEGVVETGWS